MSQISWVKQGVPRDPRLQVAPGPQLCECDSCTPWQEGRLKAPSWQAGIDGLWQVPVILPELLQVAYYLFGPILTLRSLCLVLWNPSHSLPSMYPLSGRVTLTTLVFIICYCSCVRAAGSPFFGSVTCSGSFPLLYPLFACREVMSLRL